MPDFKSPVNVNTPQYSSNVCDLCGLALSAGRFEAPFSGKTYQFCCQGCRQVFSILIEAADSGDPAKFRDSDLFKQCLEKGIIPRSEADLVSTQVHGKSDKSPSGPTKKPAPAGQLEAPRDGVLSLNLKISNMWCPACAWLIDESLKKTPGVMDSACNFSTDRLQVNYSPILTSPDRIIDAVKKLGYRAAEPDESRDVQERRREFMRFAISAFLTMNIMMLSYALYSGFFTEFSPDTIYKLSWPAFIMATMVVFYGGFELFKKAWSGLTNAAFSMETLIIMGSMSAYVYSTVNLFAGSIHIYYDTAAMLITLVLLGKTLERRAKGRVLEGLENFFSLKPSKVRICTDEYPAGRYVSADHLSKKDIFRVDENEIIPADGRVIDGSGTVDESSITGEPLPIRIRPGNTVRSGTSVIKGTLKVSAQKVGAGSTLGQMIAIIEKTLMTKTPLEGKTDAVLQWFVPIIITMATGTALICLLMDISMEEAILRAVTVLVISCPCALGIAIPLARVAGISIAGKKGLLVRDFKAFEQAQRVTAFVFDKTGTITAGKWNLLDIACDESLTTEQALALAAGLEKDSEHFIAIEILSQAQAKNIQPLSLPHTRHDDQGIQGEFNGQTLKIGSAEFLDKELKSTNTLGDTAVLDETANHSFVYLGIDSRLAAIFVFGDTLRPDALKTVQKLKSKGLRLALVSGDGEHTTKAVAEKIGIQQALGGQLPGDKSRFIIELQQKGYRVAMVGDGINDAPAMVQADLSIAVHSGGQLSKEAADITLMRGEPSQLLQFLDFAEQVNKKIYQNLAFTFLYNAASIPIAMSGLLNPLVAVTAMLLSSLSVTGNTLMLVRRNT
ncbi:Lead, cadmium, zinc and mercury transporting ATPase (EC (EC; Copper-translocating P-type ATPase (EC [Olavius sp. associated proteobacterium Delta 1]|nr:Lead, cadmium, zinc and mercury transporting ATPase (EC (EC; Copper-translocating P-type ATPase (EC [Olavius sp. associated proteobacterium Delta 1]